MAAKLTISGKVMGKTRPAFADWELTLPAAWAETAVTLRLLLTHLVQAEVDAFNRRQEQRQLFRILSPAQIQLGLEQGKIEAGGCEFTATVDGQTAVDTALQAFSDGLYVVFLNDEQIETLETAVTLTLRSQLFFLRLVPLVGG